MIVCGMFVLSILSVSLCRCTVSKALLMSNAIIIVLCGGCNLLKPLVMVLFMLCNAVVVECLVLKPCWCDRYVMLFVMNGCMIFSSVLAMGERREIGL